MLDHHVPDGTNEANGFAPTAAQKGVWIDQSIDPSSTNYNIGEYLEICGEIDLTVFRSAMDRVIAEAEPFHVRFVVEGDELRQVPRPGADYPFTLVDMTSDPAPRASAERWLEDYLAQSIDPMSGPLVSCALLKVASGTWFWCARYHHMINDGFGVAMIARRFAQIYTAMMSGSDPGPSPFGTLAEVLAEDDEYRRSEHFSRDRSYWKERLAGAPEPVSLSQAQWLRSARFTRRTAHVPFAKAQALRALAKGFGLTLPQLITVASAVYLHGMTGEQDVVVGYSVAGRLGARASRLLNMLSNVAPIRFSIEDEAPFAELAQRAARNLREAMRRQRYRIADIRRDLGRIDRPLYGVLVNVMAFDYDMTFAGHRVIAHNLANGPVDDLSISIYDRLIDDDVRIDFDANPLRYSPEEVEAHASRFVALLSNLVDARFESEPAKSIGRVPLILPEERQLLARWNDTAAYFPSDKCLHELIAEQARRTPEAVAVAYEDAHLTYAELDARANQLAHHLRTLGVGPDVVVGLCFERSLEMVIGLLGILKAGGAYLPLDPGNPAERLVFMLADAKSPAVVTRADLADRLSASPAHIVRLDADAQQISAYPVSAPETGVEPHNLAYVIYTSGSTGKPKGAMNEHRAVVNRLCWMQSEYRLTPNDSVLQKTPFTFDVSVWEFLWTLMYGARLVMARPEGHKDPSYLVEIICREAITTLHFVPSMLHAFLQYPDVERCSSIKRVICSGEALPSSSQDELFRRLDTELHNLYGPTEAAIDVTYWQCRRDDRSTSVPIGRPVWNTQIHILNSALTPVPIGVAGELYIAGVQVGRGYLGRPDLTQERFIADPFAGPGRRMYRAGDIARWRADGALEYLGRIDHQVKIRGLRIELGEIEVALKQRPELRDAAVVVREDVPGNKQLVAYLVAAAGAAETPREELRAALGRTLPDYMVPATYMWLPALPLTSSGKLDRKALPAPEFAAAADATSYVAPHNDVEAVLAGIWQDVLRLKQVGVTDKFFEIGGDSILSMLVISKAKRAGLRITPNQIFQHQTIAALAAVAETVERSAETREPVSGPVPLTAIQSWFFEHEFAEPQHWNQMITLAVAEGVGPELLQLALQALVDHHDALRLRFHRSEAGWRQDNLGLGERIMLARIDLSQQDAARREDVLREAAVALNSGLDLATGPLIRAAWVDLGAGQPRQLLIAIHHLAVDGVSWRILLEDLQSVCHQLRRGEAVRLPAKTTSFKTWAEQVVDHAQSDSAHKQAEYWRSLPEASSRALPRDLPSGNNTEGSARTVSLVLDEEETDRLLHKAPQAFRTQINDILLAALGMTLAQWMSTPHIQIDLEGHGRDLMADSADLSRTVGWFTSIFPVRLEVNAAGGLSELLKSIKEQLRAIPNGGAAYGVLRYMSQDGAVRDRLRALPRSEIAFNYLGQFDQALASDVFTSLQSFSASRSAHAARPHLLVIDAIVAKGQLRLDWTYSENVHRREAIVTLAQNYMACVRELIEHCTSGLAAGCTPSDFPDANLSQQELDTLVAQVGNVADIEAIYPQSPTQQGMLFAALFAPASGTDIEQAIFTMNGSLQVASLRRAWEEAMLRHDVLRTLFVTASLDTPLQVVLRRAELPWQELDWRNGSEAQHAEWRKRLLEEDRRRGFDAGKAPLMRITVIRLADDRYAMLWTHHHILLDGWSVSLILKEVAADYSARCDGKTASFKRVPPYREFISWLHRQHSSEAEAIWRPALKGFKLPTRLGAGSSSNRVRATATHRLTFSAHSTALIDSFARRHGLTLNTVVTAAWSLLLSRASRQERVLFGASSSGRPTELDEVESMVGLFASPLPMPVHVTPQSQLLSWLRALQDQLLALRKHQHASLADIQGWSEVSPGEPMFQSLVAFENYPLDESADANTRWLGIEHAELVEQTNYPLVVTVVPLTELLNIFTYDVDCFDGEAIARIARSFEAIFPAMIAALDAPVSQVLEAIEITDARQEPARGSSRVDTGGAFVSARESSNLSLVDGGARNARADHVEPRTNIEYTLVKIVARVLGVEKLGMHDDFFELGMSSIAAVRIVNELNRAFNLKLGVAALFRYRTVEQLAKGAVSWEQPLIVQMAEGKSGPPVYIINAGAHQFQIARFVGDGRRPVFAIDVPLQSSWCDAAKENRKDALPGMDDLISPYLDALRAHAGASRCVLVGHCFAGVVAFELGRRYEESGGKVDSVVLLDSPMPVRRLPVALRHWKRIWGLAEDGARNAGAPARMKRSLHILSWLIKEVVNKARDDLRQQFATAALTGARDENGRFVEAPILDRIHGWALKNYARRRMNAAGLLVRAEAFAESERPYREYDPTLGWSTSFAGGLKTLHTKGNHLSMIEDDENMASMAREVNALLNEPAASARDIEGGHRRLKAS